MGSERCQNLPRVLPGEVDFEEKNPCMWENKGLKSECVQ